MISDYVQDGYFDIRGRAEELCNVPRDHHLIRRHDNLVQAPAPRNIAFGP